MNGITAGIIGGIILLVAAVVAVVAMSSWGSTEQSSAQTYTAQQITSAESSASGSGS